MNPDFWLKPIFYNYKSKNSCEVVSNVHKTEQNDLQISQTHSFFTK